MSGDQIRHRLKLKLRERGSKLRLRANQHPHRSRDRPNGFCNYPPVKVKPVALGQCMLLKR